MRITLVLLFTILIVGCGNMIINDIHTEANVAWYFQQKNAEMAQAIFDEDTDEIKRLIKEEGYDVNTRDSIKRGMWTYEWTYLNYAVTKGKFRSVKTLLDLGADIDKLLLIGSTGYSNINLASQDGNQKLIDLLLERDIKMDHTITESPLNDLMLNGHYDEALFDLFIKHGANVNHPEYISGTTPVMVAYGIRNYEATDYLLKKGANPLQIDTFGNSLASMLNRDIEDNVNVEVAQKYKQRLIDDYGIEYPIEVSYRKGFEQSIKRFENATAKEKEIMGASELERIEGLRKSLVTGVYNDIPID